MSGKARQTFISEINTDEDTLLRAGPLALWKATFEICQITDKNIADALLQKRIIDEVVD